VSRGNLLWADGKLDVKEGAGRYINRPPFSVVHEAMKKQGELKAPKPVVRHAAE
jgi:dihydropyrimidinase